MPRVKPERHWPLRHLVVAPGYTDPGKAHLFLYGKLGPLYDFHLTPAWEPYDQAEARWVEEQYEYPVRLIRAALRAWDRAGRTSRVSIGFAQHEPVVEAGGQDANA